MGWAVFPKSNLRVLSGEVRWHSSSPGIRWGFCGGCGTLVFYERDSRPDHADVTTVTLDEPNAFPPTVEIWTQDKLEWEQLNDRIPHKARSSLNE